MDVDSNVSHSSGQEDNLNMQANTLVYQHARNVCPRTTDDDEEIHRAQHHLSHNGHETVTEPAQSDNPNHIVPENNSVMTVSDMMEEKAISIRKVLYSKLLHIAVQTKKGENYTVCMKGKSSRS